MQELRGRCQMPGAHVACHADGGRPLQTVDSGRRPFNPRTIVSVSPANSTRMAPSRYMASGVYCLLCRRDTQFPVEPDNFDVWSAGFGSGLFFLRAHITIATNESRSNAIVIRVVTFPAFLLPAIIPRLDAEKTARSVGTPGLFQYSAHRFHRLADRTVNSVVPQIHLCAAKTLLPMIQLKTTTPLPSLAESTPAETTLLDNHMWTQASPAPARRTLLEQPREVSGRCVDSEPRDAIPELDVCLHSDRYPTQQSWRSA